MRKYWVFYKLNLQNALIYRGPMLIWIIGGMITTVTISAMWQAADGSTVLGGFTRSELISYYVMGYLFQWITGWYPFSNVQEDIKNGDLMNKILKPISYFWLNIFNELSWHTVSVFFAVVAVVLGLNIMGVNIVLPLSDASMVLLILSLLVSTVLAFSFSMCLGLLTLWVTEAESLNGTLFWGGIALLGGQVIPLSFIPDNFHRLTTFLPYRYLFSFPLEIYFSKIAYGDAILGLLIGSSWLIIFLIIYQILWAKGLKAYAAFGH